MRVNKKTFLAFVVVGGLALSSSPLWSQSCDLAGTWYGGGETAKYVMSITRDHGGNYSSVSQGAFSAADLGFPLITIFSGSFVKGPGKSYEGFASGMVNTTTNFPFLTTDPAANPQVWAVHATVHLVDCNTLREDYDFFGAYLWQNAKTPFVDAPDYVVVPPPFSETYKRMPTHCAHCG